MTRAISAYLALLAIALSPIVANADSIELNGSMPIGPGSISGTLHGDLTANVLTLNSGTPVSEIAIDTAVALPLSLEPIRLPSQGFGGPLGFEAIITIMPNLSALLEVPAWNFDIFGSADLNAGTASLTGAPQAPGIIATLDALAAPTFSAELVCRLGRIACGVAESAARLALDITLGLLNTDTVIDLVATSFWDTLSTGSVTAAANQTGEIVEIDLTLMSAMLAGTFDYELDLEFESPGLISSLLGDLFEPLVERRLETRIDSWLSYHLDSSLDIESSSEFGMYAQDCSGDMLDRARFGVSCEINTQISLSGVLPDGSVSVPEPGTLVLLGIGLLGMGAARRRKKV